MKKILNNGFIELIDYMGNDQRILDAARVSTGASSKGDINDRGLIRYLLMNDHTSPFEKVVFEFHVRLPIFIARQWMRHRTSSFNEVSARYKEFEWDCWKPEEWRKQGTTNHQASSNEKFTDLENEELFRIQRVAYEESENAYHDMLESGVSREIARSNMPVGQYTEFYWTVNYHNLMHFLTLRNHSHAQPEIQVYGVAIEEILSELNNLKWSYEIFKEMQELKNLFKDAVNKDLNQLKQHLKDFVG